MNSSVSLLESLICIRFWETSRLQLKFGDIHLEESPPFVNVKTAKNGIVRKVYLTKECVYEAMNGVLEEYGAKVIKKKITKGLIKVEVSIEKWLHDVTFRKLSPYRVEEKLHVKHIVQL